MISDITLFVYAFTSIFAIVNPLSGVMAFVSLTSKMSVADKLYVAKRSVVIACHYSGHLFDHGRIFIKRSF